MGFWVTFGYSDFSMIMHQQPQPLLGCLSPHGIIWEEKTLFTTEMLITLTSTSLLQTMTFYEGGDASNGETPAALDTSSASVTAPTDASPPATAMDTTPASPPPSDQ